MIDLKPLNNKGATILEALVSILVISLMLTASISIIVGVHRHTAAANERILAIEIATRVRDELTATTSFTALSAWQNGMSMTVTYENLLTTLPPFPSHVFNFESNNRIYNDSLTIVFEVPSPESLRYQIIRYQITIEYYPQRFITIDGVIYE